MKRIIAILILVVLGAFMVSCLGDNTQDSTPNSVEYIEIFYDAGEGELSAKKEIATVESGSNHRNHPKPVREGYKFTGWYLDEACTEKVTATKIYRGDTTLYAGWEKETDNSGSIPDIDSTLGTDSTVDSLPSLEDSTPSSTLEPTPDSIDSSFVDSIPDSVVDSAPDSTPESIPESIPDSTLESTPDSTPESTPDSTPDSTPESKPERPPVIIVPDRTDYTPKSTGEGDNRFIYYINKASRYPHLSPYYNGYKTALTMTFDDGYDTNTGTVVSNQFEKYGYRGTMMLGVTFINNQAYIDEWNRVFARGYLDLGCHGYDHKNPVEISASEYEKEIKEAILFLRAKFPTQRVLTFATPLAHINTPYETYLKDFVIGNRLEEEGDFVNLKDSLDYNPYRVKAISVNTRANLNTIHSSIVSGIEYGNWIVELYHCVKDGASGVDMERSDFEFHCEYIYRNFRDDLWITTFESVLLYGEELKHTTVEYTACDRESLTFTVTPDGTLDKELYNIPLSLTVYLPSFIDSAYATVNGEYRPLELTMDYSAGDAYGIVKDIPATEKSEVIVYIGGNKTMKNNCVHSYSVVDVIEPTHDTFGYTLNQCSKCENEYKTKITQKTHDYTGEEVVVIAPSADGDGLTKFYCKQCDNYEVREIPYE